MGATEAQIFGVAEIAENKIKLYLIVITINYIDLKKKTRVLHLNSGLLKIILGPLVAPMETTSTVGRTRNPLGNNIVQYKYRFVCKHL
jgi:hypothetical protein